jgi:hypothetical protein
MLWCTILENNTLLWVDIVNLITFVGLIVMKNVISRNKPIATLDAENHRYIITPVDPDEPISVRTVLRSIKETTHTTWRALMEFTGYSYQSDIFKMTYAGQHCSKKLRARLAEYITKVGEVAYLYDKDHKPAGPGAVLIHPTLFNNETDVITTPTKVFANIATRVSISDKLDRKLKLTVSTDAGYITDGSKFATTNLGTMLVAYGTARKLNAYLKTITYASDTVGTHEVVITVNDLTGVPAGILTSSVTVKVTAGVAPVIPTLNVPATANVTQGEYSALPKVTVSAEGHDELMTLRITPVNCRIYDLRNYLWYKGDDDTYTAQSTAANINANLANLKACADEEGAKILFELGFGNSRIRKYMALSFEQEDDAPPVVGDAVVGNTVVGGD